MKDGNGTAKPVVPLGVPRVRGVPLRRRWALRRQGRWDGRRGQPDPLLLNASTTTPMRDLLHAEFDHRAADVARRLADDSRPLSRRLVVLDTLIDQANTKLAVAQAELARIESARSDPAGAPERRSGETRHPESLLRARRTREHDRLLARVRAEIQQAQHDLRTTGVERTAVQGELDARHREAATMLVAFQAMAQREQAVYDQALMRRHPTGDLLQPLLDITPPRLPAWASAPSVPQGA